MFPKSARRATPRALIDRPAETRAIHCARSSRGLTPRRLAALGVAILIEAARLAGASIAAKGTKHRGSVVQRLLLRTMPSATSPSGTRTGGPPELGFRANLTGASLADLV